MRALARGPLSTKKESLLLMSTSSFCFLNACLIVAWHGKALEISVQIQHFVINQVILIRFCQEQYWSGSLFAFDRAAIESEEDACFAVAARMGGQTFQRGGHSVAQCRCRCDQQIWWVRNNIGMHIVCCRHQEISSFYAYASTCMRVRARACVHSSLSSELRFLAGRI